MAAITATHNAKAIKRAMKTIGLDDRTDDLLNILDKMELDRRLKISMEQADRGEEEDVFEALKEIKEEIRNER